MYGNNIAPIISIVRAAPVIWPVIVFSPRADDGLAKTKKPPKKKKNSKIIGNKKIIAQDNSCCPSENWH